MAAGKFQIIIGKNGQCYFRLFASNNEIILSSEGYASNLDCMVGIDSVKENSVDNKRYEKITASNNQHYFVLKAGNGEVIGKSQMYNASHSRDEGILSVT